jgi:hypothetical protein
MKAMEEQVVVHFMALFQHNTGENENNQTYVQIRYRHNMKSDHIIRNVHLLSVHTIKNQTVYVVDVDRRTIF